MKTINSVLKTLEIEKKDKKNLSIILLVFVLSCLVLYAYYHFFTESKLQLVYQNWDGPSYVVIAKSLYNNEIIPQVNTLRLPTEYFAAHFPLYPLLIRLFSFIGYFRSMIFVSLLSTVLFLFSFYILAKDYSDERRALYLSLGLIFITPRWFIVSRVGSSEPLFLFLLCLMIVLINRKKILLAAIVMSLAQLTRIQGILIFAGLSLYYAYLFFKGRSFKELVKEFIPFLLAPLSFLGVFFLYKLQFNNFFAFFEAQKITNVSNHLQIPPFAVLLEHYSPHHALESWKELYLIYYFFITYTVISLFNQKKALLGFLGLSYALPLFFIVHIDLARYSLPLLPLFFIALKDKIGTKAFLLSVVLLLPAIYIYAINYMNFNLSP